MTTDAERRAIPFWRDERVLKWAAQIVSAIAVIAFLAFFIGNVLAAARVRGLDLGFDFLDDTAGFALGESLIPYEPSMTFGRAFLVGLLNTLKVALVGIVLATFLGLLAALARLSSNWLVNKLFYIAAREALAGLSITEKIEVLRRFSHAISSVARPCGRTPYRRG